MKKILLIVIKIIGLWLFIPLCIVSFVGFHEGDFLSAVFTFLFGAVPSFFIIRSFIPKEKRSIVTVQDINLSNKVNNENQSHAIKPTENTNERQINKGNATQNHTVKIPSISKFDYNRIKQFQAKQLLESIYILETTKNFDTLCSRMDFIEQIYKNFIPASKINTYQNYMTEAIDTYKTMYYDRILTENQISLLLHPNLQNIQLFYSDCIVHCYERYVEHQILEINKLKTNAAKEKRKDDIIKKGYSAKYMFKEYNLPDIGHLDSIENIRKQFYSYQKPE
jgi:hypothetical protein